MRDYLCLLENAINKQIELIEQKEWSEQILSLAPPILWFGNVLSDKSKILTIGANPSRSEFLAETKKSLENKTFDKINYLSLEKVRLYTLSKGENFSTIKSEQKNNIIKSYNEYFLGNTAYKKWFGKENGGKVEGLMNGFEASFYGNGNKQAIHIDLIPFATLNDFKSKIDIINNSLFENEWAQGFLKNLIKKIDPDLILVFGNTNYDYFKRFFKIEELFTGEYICKQGKKHTKYYISYFNDKTLIGFNANFGNTNFSRIELLELGGEVTKNINLMVNVKTK